MARILLILLLVAGAVVLIYKLGEMSRPQRIRLLKWLALLLLILLFVGLAATGRLSWLFALIASLVPLIPRIVNWIMRMAGPLSSLLGHIKPGFMKSGPTIQTDYFRMVVDLLKGAMDGEILKGEFQGRRLAELNLDQLLQLLKSVVKTDQESAALLAAFLDRHHPGWRQSFSESDQQSHDWNSQGEMTEQEAREILGVSVKASKDDIQAAHRKLMQKLHPDRGGSDYLATKINQARDRLLKA